MFEIYNRPYCCRHIVYIVLIATIIINVCIYLLYRYMMKHTVKEVEVVRAFDQKRGTLCRKECDCNESTGEKAEMKT